MKFKLAAGVCLAASILSGGALAQTPQEPVKQPVNPHLLGRLTGGSTLERFLTALRAEFARMDADGNGILDQSDLDLHEAMGAANLRTSFAIQIMRSDLDGDGAVTEAEIRKRLQYEWRSNGAMQRVAPPGQPSPQERLEQEIRKAMAADTDKDARVTWKEAAEHYKQQPGYAQAASMGMSALGRQMIALAPAGKSSITVEQFVETATAFFHTVDSDGNGTISLDELDVVRKEAGRANAEAARQRMQESVRVVCDMPKASDAAKVALLGAYQTESLSSVALGSQDDVTGVGNIVVEPGKEPLYVVVASYRPTIWRFYGAVERIERAVIVSSRPAPAKSGAKPLVAAGVTGLPADRVSFPERANCLNYFTEASSTASTKAVAAVKAAMGKGPDVVAAKYAMVAFNVPSGKIESMGSSQPGLQIVQGNVTYMLHDGKVTVVKPDRSLAHEFERFSPGGVVTVDAKSVVASVPAEPYEVLPQEAGLLQLIKSGALTRNDKGEFLINKKIRIPAGLAGAHSVKFLLLRGVPEPDGDAGHSTIISEETGKPVQPHKG